MMPGRRIDRGRADREGAGGPARSHYPLEFVTYALGRVANPRGYIPALRDELMVDRGVLEHCDNETFLSAALLRFAAAAECRARTDSAFTWGRQRRGVNSPAP